MESIGTQLREAREGKGITISDAASATRIKYQHIEAMERDDFSTIAAAAYARGFIKIYAEYLDLEPSALLELYRSFHTPVEQRPSLADGRRGASARAASRASSPPPEAGEGEELPPASGDGLLPLGLVKRVILPAAGVVLIVLLAASVSRMWGGGNGGGERGDASAVEPLWLEDPPDPYVSIPGGEEDQP